MVVPIVSQISINLFHMKIIYKDKKEPRPRRYKIKQSKIFEWRGSTEPIFKDKKSINHLQGKE